jgi:hypothetical protein
LVVAVLAVVVALLGPSLVQWYRRPKLILHSDVDDDRDGTTKVPQDYFRDGPACWLRMAVTNTGRTTAEDARVILYQMSPAGRQPPIRELKWADVPLDQLAIPPRITRLIDVVRVTLERNRSGDELLGLVPGLMVVDDSVDSGIPETRLWLPVEAADYTMSVSVSAKDVQARRFVISFRLSRTTVDDNARLLRSAAVRPLAGGKPLSKSRRIRP